MPRETRDQVDQPGAILHIVCRGNNQQKIFRHIRDYKKFLNILGEVKKEFPFYLYSYNLLPNHYHLEIEVRDVSISKIMHRINTLYAIYFKHRYYHTGHLFQDRFYASLIGRESYFWEVGRYIDLNAVRAGLVKKPEDYRWSSYSVYCNKFYDGKLIDRDRFLGYHGDKDLERARVAYLEFVEEGLKEKKKPKWLKSQKFV